MLPLLSTFLFLAVAIAVFSLAAVVDHRSEQGRVIRDRLVTTTHEPRREERLVRDRTLSTIPALNRLLARLPLIWRLHAFITQADPRSTVGRFLLLTLGSFLAGVVLGKIFLANPLGWLPLAMAGSAVPFCYLARARRRRLQKFEQLFPQGVDLVARAVRAGHAFTTALEMVGSELNEPIAGEFRTVFEEQKFGLPMRDALQNLSVRIPLTDVRFFVTAILLQRETGGNLAEILDKLSYVVRERFKLLRQVRVYTAQGRLTMIILMCLPPTLALAISLLNPYFMRPLFQEQMGRIMLMTGLGLQVVGFFLIRRIVRIRV